MKEIFITAMGTFLPGEPVSNDEMEDYLGRINGQASVVKPRILKQNGIKTRHYALDKNQKTRYLNADLAANAIENALKNSRLSASEIELLITATTQGDLPVPGFASMVHARTEIPSCELASFQSVCAGGVMALQNAFHQLRSGEKKNAICVASEFASRLFKASRYETQQLKTVPFDTEFLRWMLSDGAGACVLETQKPVGKLSFRIDWIDLKSSAHDFPLCMYIGRNGNKDDDEATWLDYENYETAVQTGSMNMKQDIRLLERVVKTGVAHLFELVDKGMIDPKKIDWLCCHYSSEFFKKPIHELLQKGGLEIPEEKWFSNLTTKGNTGSASIYIMLEELLQSGKLQPGQTVLCMVPESGRCITSFMQLTVVGDEAATKSYPVREIAAPALETAGNPVAEWLVRQLTQVWIEFETQLLQVPIVKKIHGGTLILEDYKLLLHDLRQQVIDGSQWIARAASNISIDLFELRSAFLKHAAAEHKDYQILERNYKALGEDPETLYLGEKNLGSMALSAFMFQQASQPNPIDLLGSMFIIEGIGNRLAGFWGELMRDQLNLTDDQVSFFTYHGVADEHHFKNLEQALQHPRLDMEVAWKIVRTAKVTANLYKLQLEELGNY
jgi:3-oxoacyl-[acyl-carrier-protein] synthase-3